MKKSELVQDQYTVENLLHRIESALLEAGIGSRPLEWSELALLDQFHVRGLAATQELAEGLDLKGGESILDVGSGLGGPARYLAAMHGCHVTGIDLSPSFTEVATWLGARTSLSPKLTFVQGDATELPFPPESFDHVWTQHVAMNIADKEHLYRGIHRVLKKGGRLAIYDVVKGEVEPVTYPVPWAREATISFLASASEMAQALRAVGFREVSAVNTTPLALDWLANAQTSSQTPSGAKVLNLALVLGPDAQQVFANLGQNIKNTTRRSCSNDRSEGLRAQVTEVASFFHDEVRELDSL